MTNGTQAATESQAQRIERYRRLFTGVNEYGQTSPNNVAPAITAFAGEHDIREGALEVLRVALSRRAHEEWTALLHHFRDDNGLAMAINDLFAGACAAVLDGTLSFSEVEMVLYVANATETGFPFNETQHAFCINRILDAPRTSQRSEDNDRVLARYIGSAGLTERQRSFLFEWWFTDHCANGAKAKMLTTFASSCATLTAQQHAVIIEALLIAGASNHTQAETDIIRHGETVTTLDPQHHAMLLRHLLLRHGHPVHEVHDIRKITPPVVSYMRRARLSEVVIREVLQHFFEALNEDLTKAMKLDLTFDTDKVVC